MRLVLLCHALFFDSPTLSVFGSKLPSHIQFDSIERFPWPPATARSSNLRLCNSYTSAAIINQNRSRPNYVHRSSPRWHCCVSNARIITRIQCSSITNQYASVCRNHDSSRKTPANVDLTGACLSSGLQTLDLGLQGSGRVPEVETLASRHPYGNQY